MSRNNVILAIAVIFILFLASACSGSDGGKTDTTPSTSETTLKTDDEATDDSSVTKPEETSATTENTAETDETEPDGDTSQDADANLIVQTAKMLVGIPFAENGTTPVDGFDNSGFIYYVLRENGFINCPRIASKQAVMGEQIGFDQLKAGDIVFFCTDNSGNSDFGGIYIGDGMMIFSPMPGQEVRQVDITTDYWRGAFVTGVSLS